MVGGGNVSGYKCCCCSHNIDGIGVAVVRLFLVVGVVQSYYWWQ
jgi:hypothetical protein